MEKEFPRGIMFKNPNENAPDFIKGKVSIKVDEFISYLQEKADNGWVNLILKKSQKGTMYFDLDTWKPNTQKVEKYKSTTEAKPDNREYCEECKMQDCVCNSSCEECGHPKEACNCHIEVDKIPF
jgi:hypothetical protein